MTKEDYGTNLVSPIEATRDDMSDGPNRKPTLTRTGQRAAEQQHQRLASALRENLRKRKAQERARAGGQPAPPAAGDKRAGGVTE
jgi:hypothetical protein